jgi:beta-lactamase regulating signal transducer with metallopeptidase domain
VPRAPAEVHCWIWRLAYLKLFLVALWPGRVELPILPAAKLEPETASAMHAALRSAPTVVPARRSPTVAAFPVKTPPMAPPFRGAALPGALWLIGVAVGIARMRQCRGETERLRRHCTPFRDPAIGGEVAVLSRRLGLRSVPELLAGEVRTPLLIGLRRPAIVLPAEERIGQVMRSWVLAHEFAHVRRRDLLWGWLPAVARLLFFFHPLVLATRREWHLAHEAACDALAIRITRAPVAEYAAMLLALATGFPCRSLEGAIGVSGPRHALERRLIVLQYLRPRSRRQTAATGALLIVIALIGLVPWRASARSEPVTAGPQSRLAEQWEDVLLLEAMRYLRLSPGQLTRLQPLARGADERLVRLAAQEERTARALARIAQKQYAALVSGKPASLQEQADALAMERSRRRRKEQALGEITESVLQPLAHVLTREQVRRAYLLAHGEMPPNVPPRPALLDVESGFVIEPRARGTLRTDAIRKVLSRRYPAALVDATAPPAVHQIPVMLVPTAGPVKEDVNVTAAVSLSFEAATSEDTAETEPTAEHFPPAQREAIRREREGLEARWKEMTRLLLEGATEEEIVAALRPLARRMFGSPRLKPVLNEVLQKGGQLPAE